MISGLQDRMKGKSAIANQYQAQNTQFYTSAQDNITATPGAVQGTAILLMNSQNRITTAAAGSGVKLPLSQQGACVVITNDGASTTNVFPSTGDAINALGPNTAFALTVALGPTIFYCFSPGTWRTK